MGDRVTYIGNNAFSGCLSLERFEFGKSLEFIGAEAFSDCTSLISIYSKSNTPPFCEQQALDDLNKWNCKLYVPTNALNKYKVAEQWKEFFYIDNRLDKHKRQSARNRMADFGNRQHAQNDENDRIARSVG